jgi:hypothetical protein
MVTNCWWVSNSVLEECGTCGHGVGIARSAIVLAVQGAVVVSGPGPGQGAVGGGARSRAEGGAGGAEGGSGIGREEGGEGGKGEGTGRGRG